MPYTGILAPGSHWDHCLLRLSSAMQPPNQAIKRAWARGILYTTTGDKIRNAKLYPCTALKVFPDQNSNKNTTTTTRNILFGGSKVGQRETEFFAHCQCTSMTERMPAAVKPFVKKFWQYSKWPLSLGISEFCKPFPIQHCQPPGDSATDAEDTNSNINNNDENASPEDSPIINFPFALILKPRIRSDGASVVQADDDTPLLGNDGGDSDDDHEYPDDKKNNVKKDDDAVATADASLGRQSSNVSSSSGVRQTWAGWTNSHLSSFGSRRASSSPVDSSSTDNLQREGNSFDSFLDFALNGIPPETHLFDVYACPSPQDVADGSKLQRIGKIISTSTFIESTPHDGLFFKHQAKEEDYALRPDWPPALAQQVTVDHGKIKGTIGTLAGWKLFEQQISKKQYQDFEIETARVTTDSK